MRARAEQERAAAATGQGRDPAAPRARGGRLPAAPDQATPRQAEARVKTFTADPSIESGLLAIVRADSSFDPEHFLRGAKQAYEMIVTAFAEGNRKMLKDLLSREVMEGFAAAITDREKRGEIIDQSFVGINKADIVEAELKNGVAR